MDGGLGGGKLGERVEKRKQEVGFVCKMRNKIFKMNKVFYKIGSIFQSICACIGWRLP